MKNETEELASTIHNALFMQHDREYVPEWMRIAGIDFGVWLNHPLIIHVQILWSDKRGNFVWRWENDEKYTEMDENVASRLCYSVDSIGTSLEGVIKQHIKNVAEWWEDAVEAHSNRGGRIGKFITTDELHALKMKNMVYPNYK